MIRIKAAKFLTSATNLTNAPPPQYTEIVCLGRSNVGKSTLLNAIFNKPLAKSSSTPGKTKLINFFYTLFEYEPDSSLESAKVKLESLDSAKEALMLESIPLCFIDVPGFGYARVSKAQKSAWEKHLQGFLIGRKSIKCFLHLIDARHIDLELDKRVGAMLESMLQNDQKVLKIYTKADKLSQNALNNLKVRLASQANSYIFSATKQGRKIDSIEALRSGIVKSSLF